MSSKLLSLSLSLMALSCAALSAPALAQTASTAQFYGLVDAGLRIDNGLQRQARVDSGMAAGSRWGIRVTEDLGNGLRLQGNLEGGILIDTGEVAQGGRVFGRRSILGLSSASWGTVELGRQLTPLWRVTAATDAFDGLMIGNPSSNAFTRANSAYVRANNGIWYTSPRVGGLTGQLMYSAGESTAVDVSESAGSLVSGSLVWADADFSAHYAFLRNTGAVNVRSNLARPEKLQVLGGTYTAGKFKVFAGVGSAKRDAGVGTGALGRVDQVSSQLGLSYTDGNHKAFVGIGRQKDKALANANTAVWAVGYQYALSKSTSLYAGYGKRNNDSQARYFLLDAATNGSFNADTVPRGLDPSSFTFGLRHAF